MKRQIIIITMVMGVLGFGCKTVNQNVVTDETVNVTITQLVEKYGEQEQVRMEKGVKQMATLWESKDGTKEEFIEFCLENYIADAAVRERIFGRLCKQFEAIFGGFNKMAVSLLEPTHVTTFESFPIDEAFGAWSPTAHFEEDFFDNKIAFYVMLNFPFYTLEEKNALGQDWSSLEWGYARMGDMFISRIPADLAQKISDATTYADNYIADYNIYMGYLVDGEQNKLFPEDMTLITHWGLRDELKAQYADATQGLVRQQMIYEVMKHIIYQTIPVEVINKNDYTWDPYQNKIYKDGTEAAATPEPSTRYGHLLNIFKAMKAVDPYTPMYPTYISRKFDQEFELSQAEVEALFIKMVGSEQVKQVGELIVKRLGRELQPFDIWYDGFKSRSAIDPAELDRMTQTKYPNQEAFVKDLPVIMTKLGFTREKADFVCSHITVDPSRGAGHAWEAAMKDDKARLRTRIGEKGMDYKGYNIGTHEFGHNVEQTITLHDVPNYMMCGVPNTAFTEALAFVFQKRDLELLGHVNKSATDDEDYLTTLDIFWGCYEIMGVSLVDMRVWKWMYENPTATKEQLKDKVIEIAKEVWNTYYYPVFGTKDEPILAIYSHMIDAPLYLSAYPLGHLVEFQLENYFKGKTVGLETPRLFANGRLTPQWWMKKGLNTDLSVDAILEATTEAVKKVK
ncbi:MAG: hypothetical protein LBC84_04710 [Prevotellaceae bacterium]|jgi:hypothetical protein|nr:hypothetical protein [Prevotellaceae bacterium]